jgi:hypothetical protein
MDFVVLDEASPAGDGWRLTAYIHAPEKCVGPCAFHAPSDHPLADAPLTLRPTMFFGMLAVRVCEHGIEHVDPDAVAWLRAKGVALNEADCSCGCCTRETA